MPPLTGWQSTRAVRFRRVLGSAPIVYHGVSFELYQPVRVDEARDLHDGVGGPYIAKELAVDCGYGLPVLDSSQQRSCPHNMAQGRSCLFKSGSNNLEASTRLSGGISLPDSATVRA